MKSILISIKPEWVAKILNGEKTIEIRKTMPKCDLPIDVYIYATKEEYLHYGGGYYGIDDYKWIANKIPKSKRKYASTTDRNGKVVAKFTLKKCEEWHNYSWYEITKKGCVSDDELRNYSKGKASLYIWHIDNLVIFDKPKELGEFSHWVKYQWETIVNGCEIKSVLTPLQKAPQSWCYIETEDK